MLQFIKKWLAARAEQRRKDEFLIAIVDAMKREHEAMCQQIAWQIIMSGKAKEFLGEDENPPKDDIR